MDVWNLVADRKIQEAMDEGAFERLEGAGKPLDLSENPFENPADRMANRLLRNNGFAPAWMLEGQEIDREIRRLQALRATLTEVEYSRRVNSLNRQIASYNLKVPINSLQKLLLSPPPIG